MIMTLCNALNMQVLCHLRSDVLHDEELYISLHSYSCKIVDAESKKRLVLCSLTSTNSQATPEFLSWGRGKRGWLGRDTEENSCDL